jgi:hypothetical protein
MGQGLVQQRHHREHRQALLPAEKIGELSEAATTYANTA